VLKKKKLTGKEAEKTILEYLQQQNRPYNLQTIIDNLHGIIGKKEAQNILTSLNNQKVVTCKEFGTTKLYWRNQDDLPVADPKTLKDLDEKFESLEGQRDALNEECKQIASEIQMLASIPTDAEADKKIQELSIQNQKLKEQLTALKSNSTPISPKDREKIVKQYNSMKGTWKKRKRQCEEIINEMQEGSGKRFKELAEEIGLETDEDFKVSPDNDNTAKLKKGEL